MLKGRFVVVDFETTGLSPALGERITEVAMVRIVDGEITDHFASLVNTGKMIPPMITQITGITQAMVDRAPPVTKIVTEAHAFLGQDVFVAHNAPFDTKFWLAELEQAGLMPQHQDVLCTLRLSRRLLPIASHKLTSVAQYCGFKAPGTAHRALYDAQITAQALLHFVQLLGQPEPIRLADLQRVEQQPKLSPPSAYTTASPPPWHRSG